MTARTCFGVVLVAMLGLLGAPPARAADPATQKEDDRPVVNDPAVGADKAARGSLPTIFCVGDSTLNSNGNLRGWANELPPFFDLTKVNVVNRAIGGRSSRTFITEGRWDKVLAELKSGDVVLVQFGHNDAGDYKNPAAKGRPSLKGEGDETAEALKSDGTTTEMIHSFGWYLRKYSTDAKAKGAKVVLCSMVPHQDWQDGKIKRGERGSLVKWTENAATATGAQYLDLNEIVAEGFEKLGPAKVKPLFGDARTHSTVEGAKFNAAAVVSGLKLLQPDPAAGFYSKAGEDVAPAVIAAEPGAPK